MDNNTTMIIILLGLFVFALIIAIVGLITEYQKYVKKLELDKRKLEVLENAVLMGYKPEELNKLQAMIEENMSTENIKSFLETLPGFNPVATKNINKEKTQEQNYNQPMKY